VTDEQQAALVTDERHLRARLGAVEAARQRRQDGKAGALLLRPALGRQLGGLARPDLGAVQDGLEAQAETRECQAGHPGLPFAPLGQAPLRILAASVRLGVCVTK